jgi:capsular exopolysaccharide synthesis family protein
MVVVTATDTVAPRAFITANLAASWALSGRRTIVVAGDMRRPEIADLLPVEPQWSGERGAARPTLVPNLSIVPVSDSPLDPADYLATDEVRARLEELREQADVVVVDAPPVLAAADATILGTYADGVVLVTSPDKSDRDALEAASERLRTNGVTLLGVVLSGVRSKRRKSYATSYGEQAAAERPPAHVNRPLPTQAPAANLDQPDLWLPTETAASPRTVAAPRRTVSRPVVVADDEPIPVPDVPAD